LSSKDMRRTGCVVVTMREVKDSSDRWGKLVKDLNTVQVLCGRLRVSKKRLV